MLPPVQIALLGLTGLGFATEHMENGMSPKGFLRKLFGSSSGINILKNMKNSATGIACEVWRQPHGIHQPGTLYFSELRKAVGPQTTLDNDRQQSATEECSYPFNKNLANDSFPPGRLSRLSRRE